MKLTSISPFRKKHDLLKTASVLKKQPGALGIVMKEPQTI
jgi:hypothetical protein